MKRMELQKNIHSSPIILKTPTTVEEISRPPSTHPPRFVLIYSEPISVADLATLQLHCNGSIVVQYAPEIFNGTPLENFNFNYCVFNIDKDADLTYVRQNISTWNEYTIIISKDDPETNEWIKVLMDANLITNYLKTLPTGNLNKSVFDQRLLHTVQIPHHKGFWRRLRAQLTPDCLANFVASVVEVGFCLHP